VTIKRQKKISKYRSGSHCRFSQQTLFSQYWRYEGYSNKLKCKLEEYYSCESILYLHLFLLKYFNWLKFASNYDVTFSSAPILESQSAIFPFFIPYTSLFYITNVKKINVKICNLRDNIIILHIQCHTC